MANSNFPGYMELKVESYDDDTRTGKLNIPYNEIESYFRSGDGQMFLRVPNYFGNTPGMRATVILVGSNTIVVGDSGSPVTLYMTGGSSKAFSLTEPTP